MTGRHRRILGLFTILLLGASGAAVTHSWVGARSSAAEHDSGDPYDPLAVARAKAGELPHREAGIPAQCYTKTEGTSNPCWVCHTDSHYPNSMSDFRLQAEYAFSEAGQKNHWTNLFVDHRPEMSGMSDAWIERYVRTDNYGPLRTALQKRADFPGYVPDLDFVRGFDDQGFARDGSSWRAFRYKPFPGTFWPTNGSTDDVLIRLPAAFRQLAGKPSLIVYRANLALLEASLATDPSIADGDVRFALEPIDERVIQVDLDRNGKLEDAVTQLVGLPRHFVGDAHHVRLWRALYPEGTEFLHSVRYLDPEASSFIARRMKELRYMKKLLHLEPSQLMGLYEHEHDEKDAGRLPIIQGSAETGLRNDFGWMLQAYIEDAAGRLRLQTHQEQLACMGCHGNLGVTVDQTFAFARKVPGARGWGYQDLRGMQDVPELGHSEPEFATYLERVGGGDEFRANEEMLARFFPEGRLDEAGVRRAAPGGDRDLAWLLLPSRERALELNRAYVALVRRQAFERGRDAVLAPATRVFTRIENESTKLDESGRVYRDGRLRLTWPAPSP